MAAKVEKVGPYFEGGPYMFWFKCPGCKNQHGFTFPGGWSFNGNYHLPTFVPSLLCNHHDPKTRCHLFVTGGKIRFLEDCWHELKGKTVEMEDVEK